MKNIMKGRHVRDIEVGGIAVGFFLVREKTMAQTKAGKAYLTLDLQDASGRIDAKVWDSAEAMGEQFGKGDVVKVQAMVEEYRGEPQLNVRRIRKAEEGEYDLSEMLPRTPEDVDELWQTLCGSMASIENEWLVKLLGSFFDDESFREAFKRSVAARDVHHAYIGGLLEHTVSVARVCDFFAGHYGADRDLLLAGAVLHDVGKVVELDSVREFNYTVPGGMIGHIVLGVQMVSERISRIEGFPEELAMLIEHMVLSHQGQADWGSPIPPKTREAVLLHFADNVDTKHWLANAAIEEDADQGDPFTRRVRYVGHSYYRGAQ